MAYQAHVGSLDAWLPSSPLSPASQARHQSPFATVVQAARSRSQPESIAVPRLPPTARPGRLLELIQHDVHAACGTQHSAFPEFAARDTNGNTSVLLQGNQLRQGCHDFEGTVRCGKLRLPAGPQPPQWSRSDSQLILSKYPGYENRGATLAPSTSLPHLGPQAAVSLASLCTALSSPAAHVSLATADSRCSGADATATGGASTAATYDIRSMSWSADRLPEIPNGLRHVQSSNLPGAGAVVRKASVEPAPVLLLPPLGSRRGSSPTGAPATHTSRAADVAGSTTAPLSPSSVKRGLYEGTVRGGIPRNTWRSCAAQ